MRDSRIFFHLLPLLLFLLSSISPPVQALLCAFGCRELPAQQIVSSAQFRSFIMPRDVRLHGCIGCCGACGDGGDDAVEGGGEENAGGGGADKPKIGGLRIPMAEQEMGSKEKPEKEAVISKWHSLAARLDR
jgi:hypothetical protein